MIIQCEKCKTKYRFEDSNIEGEGIWVRCMNCQKVFFLDNPAIDKIVPLTDKLEEGPQAEQMTEEASRALNDMYLSKELEHETTAQEEEPVYESDDIELPMPAEEEKTIEVEEPEISRMTLSEEDLKDLEIEIDRNELEGHDDFEIEKEEEPPSEHLSLDDLMKEQEETPHEDAESLEKEIPAAAQEDERKANERGDELAPLPLDTGEEEGSEPFTNEREKAAESHRKPKGSRKLLSYLILVLLVFGGVYLWLFPDMRQMISHKISGIPGADKIMKVMGNKNSDVKKIGAGITFIDVKERFTKHWIYGNVLVVEGAAGNNNEYMVSQIKVRGKVVDTAGKVLMEEESFCGNILTDEELGNLTEKEIRKELSDPFGRNFSNRKIPSKGSIPFMLVFTSPPKEAGEFIVELAKIEAAQE